VEKILEIKPDILGLSALLTTTMPAVKDTVDAIVEAGIRDEVKILVGGAPLSQEFADEIGADAFAPDANVAARVAKNL
jgi:5-methyltetrahydrofolate--homocysteine methyltransferase